MKALDRDYFNEIDPIACAVLKATQGGFVDERSIKEVAPDDVRGYRHVHWFAGAGIWAVAARMASWPSTIPLWTGSCPCQPFSVAGKGRGAQDERHLWPDFFRLINACRPGVVVGEQVGGKAGYGWLDGVRSDLEGIGYACWAVDIPACATDAPHRRNRIYWCAVGDADNQGRLQPQGSLETVGGRGSDTDARGTVADAYGGHAGSTRLQRCGEQRFESETGSHPGIAQDCQRPEISMADADGGRRDGRSQDTLGHAQQRDAAERADDDLGDASGEGFEGLADAERFEGSSSWRPDVERTDRRNSRSFWDDAEWIMCADGKARRTKCGLPLLAYGVAGRADMWRLAGNSIVPQLAAQVLSALLETLEDAP